MEYDHHDELIYDEDYGWQGSTCEDVDVFSYTDEDHVDEDDVLEETSSKGKRQKSAERLLLEADLRALYEEYMHPTKEWSAYRIQCQLDDLYLLLYKLNMGWAYSKAKSYKLAGFTEADGEDALSVGCAPVYDLLKKDRATGNYCSYPVGHYLRIAQNKAIDDYFRARFGRLPSKKKPTDDGRKRGSPSADDTTHKRKVPYTISLDAPISADDGGYRGERWVEVSVDPFADPQRPRWERDDKSNRLTMLFIREVMDHPSDPPKPLALMYGNILFQLYKDHGGDDELSMMAKRSTRISSPEWAHRRMGRANLFQLGAFAERIVQKCYGKSLSWGSAFDQHMLERTADGAGRKWADMIYTQTYTTKDTSDWIESISKSTMIKCSRKLIDDPDLLEYAIETFGAKNKFRKALEKMERGIADETSVR